MITNPINELCYIFWYLFFDWPTHVNFSFNIISDDEFHEDNEFIYLKGLMRDNTKDHIALMLIKDGEQWISCVLNKKQNNSQYIFIKPDNEPALENHRLNAVINALEQAKREI